jgi:o-succinylbenzoate synthase
VREGVLLRGPRGWGEFCPFAEYADREAAHWLDTALEQVTTGWPEPVRDRIPVNCTVPAVGPDRAHDLVAGSGCRTAKVKIADHPGSLPEDLARVEAVRSALGPGGAIRVDANAVWDVATAVRHIREIDRAAGGLEYVEQPCRTIEELADVRRRVEVPIAADESIRRAEDPLRVAVAGAADIAVLKCMETSVGLAAQLALAGALPELDHACGLGTVNLFEGDIVTESLRPVDGFLPVPRTTPAPDPDLLKKYRHPDPERTEWWIARMRRLLESRHTEV